MPEDLREAIEHYRKTRSHEGRRRQLQFVGKLLRRVDPAPLANAVERFQSGRSADAERLHVIERWRDALIADDEAITRWIDGHPDTDVQQLRSLIRAARSEGAGAEAEQRQPKSYRQLFRLIRRALETADPA
jgi:ribosome-associated protein